MNEDKKIMVGWTDPENMSGKFGETVAEATAITILLIGFITLLCVL